MEMVETQDKYFIQISLDRETSSPVIKYSTLGGMSYSKIMSQYPDQMKVIHVDFLTNLRMDSLLNVAVDLGIENQKSQLTFILKHLYDLFVERDVEIVELNPLVITVGQ